METLYNVWKKSNSIGRTNWNISGDSVAGLRTAFQIPELKIQLDAGHQSFNKITDIFITHSHADHIASLPLIILENISNKITTNIYCPKESKVFIENMLFAFIMCNYNNGIVPKKYINFILLDPLYMIDLKLNKQDIKVQSFYSEHTVPTLSYGFVEKKKKLKEEYQGLSGKEIVKLKSEGIEITNISENKKLVFCGDTSINIFKINPDILTYDNIIIECTFFEEDDLKLAHDRKHMHWLDLKEIVIRHPLINFYLIHVSAKYHDSDYLNSIISEYNNVFIL